MRHVNHRRDGAVRYSLLSILTAMTLIAMALTIAWQWRMLKPLREDLRRLRREVGELNVDDPTKLHVIEVDSGAELEWKWRLWIPDGARYMLRSAGRVITRSDFPSDGGSISLNEPGEHVVRYVIRRDPRDGKWYGETVAETGSVGRDAHIWVESPRKTSTGDGVGKSQQSFPPDQRVLVRRFRVSQTATSSDKIEDPSEGFLLWLEPQ